MAAFRAPPVLGFKTGRVWKPVLAVPVSAAAPRGARGVGSSGDSASGASSNMQGPSSDAGPLARQRSHEIFAAERSKREFYRETGRLLLGPVELTTKHDSEVLALFLPALIALLLEPLQQLGESILVGRLGVPELGALGLGTLLFQFSLGFLSSLIFATTPRVAAAWPDRRAASTATAHGVWVALLCGLALQAGVFLKAPDVITYMASGDVTVASLAVLYLRARSWGLPAALVMMVAIGASRGAKDMTTPLLGSLAYLVGLLGADLALLPLLGMEGAGYGAAIAQWVGALTVVALLTQQGAFDPRDLARSLPRRSEVLPYFTMAVSLSVNNLSALAPTLCATTLATSLGPSSLAAHTVLRQLMGFWLQAFASFNATAHSLCAIHLGRQRSHSAAEVLARIAHLAVALSLPMAAALYALRGALPGLFTSDGAVGQEVADVLPFLLLLMPADALGAVLEGGLLGATDTRWIATRTAGSTLVALGTLAAASAGHTGLLMVWVGMKVLNLAALACDLVKFLRHAPGSTIGGTVSTMSEGRQRDI